MTQSAPLRLDRPFDRGASPAILQAPPFRGRHPRISRTFRHRGGSRVLDQLTEGRPLAAAAVDRALEALRALRDERIGGTFWGGGPQPTTCDDMLWLRPQTRSGAAAMLRQARERAASRRLVCLPNAAWARRTALQLVDQGLADESTDVHFGVVDPWRLMDRAVELWVEGEDAATLLALANATPVRCFAPCDLSGWGLTEDGADVPRRGACTLAEAAHAALITGVAYRDPFDGAPAECEAVIDILADWRRLLDRNRRIGSCTGMALWKRRAVSAMLQSDGARPPLRRSGPASVAAARRRGGGVAVWTSRAPARLAEAAEAQDVPVLHVEDGFLRSIGLGSDLAPPCSLVVDSRAPHYDAEVASDLELLLAGTAFSPALLARAERLIARLNRFGLTKYNVGAAARPPAVAGRRTVLVAGQVEDDLSIRLGAASVRRNLDLLARARELEPDAVVLFKPHPDVEAGHRPGAVPERVALRHADEIVRRTSMASLLAQVDAVHVITSLSGFEALLRGREVTTHGRPFYAGWGLTRDLAPPPRRGRRLSLAELVAGALILYPVYLDPVSGLPCPPERLAMRLAQGEAALSPLGLVRALQGRLKLALATSLHGRMA